LDKKPIVSIFNLKNGVGCSTLTWHIAHTLELNIYQHKVALHNYFLKKRLESVEINLLYTNKIEVKDIDKKKFEAGIYDIGSDFNYPYVRQLINKSDVVIVPVENSHEVLVKSIATIKFVREINPKYKVFVVFNRLSKFDDKREKNYTNEAKNFILEHVPEEAIQFFYIRYSFALLKNQAQGFFFLDNFVKQDKEFKPITAFNLLRNLRWYSIYSMANGKRKNKAIEEMKKTNFFEEHQKFYTEYMSANMDISDIYDLKYNEKEKKVIKDMLILTTNIRDTYTRRWEYN